MATINYTPGLLFKGRGGARHEIRPSNIYNKSPPLVVAAVTTLLRNPRANFYSSIYYKLLIHFVWAYI